ncbi:MAG TPA: hypothetical protein PLR96_14450 [Flavobacteriales bacterium]|nr:hypothetical protein [Flavobacteriales bacterium]
MRWLFIRTDESTWSWRRIAWWWEFRRILYNLLILAFAFLIAFVRDQFMTGGGGGSPVILIAFLLLAIMLINLYYTGAWIFDVMSRKSEHSIIRWIRPRLFLFVLLSTMSVQLLVSLGLAIHEYYNGYIKLH